MKQEEYSHGDHMAELGKMSGLYAVMTSVQNEILKQKEVLDKFEKHKKEQEDK